MTHDGSSPLSDEERHKLDATKLHLEINQLRYFELLLCSFALGIVGATASIVRDDVGSAIAVVVVMLGIWVWHGTITDVRSRISAYLREAKLSTWEERYTRFPDALKKEETKRLPQGGGGLPTEAPKQKARSVAERAYSFVDLFHGHDYGSQRQTASHVLCLASAVPLMLRGSKYAHFAFALFNNEREWCSALFFNHIGDAFFGLATLCTVFVIHFSGRHVPKERVKDYEKAWKSVCS
jgi:hypothetical protein